MAKRKKSNSKKPIEQYEHKDRKRMNNPPVGLVDASTDATEKTKTYAYDPHLDPTLQWAGKAERTSFEICSRSNWPKESSMFSISSQFKGISGSVGRSCRSRRPGSEQELEDHPWDESRLTPLMQSKLNDFRNAVTAAGGIFNTTCGSAYRTLGYQLHLKEVWDAYEALTTRSTPECAFLLSVVQNEKAKHCLKYRPGKLDKPGAIQHTKGLAFDATITGPPGMDQDAIAAQNGLYRPYKDKNKPGYDPIHFELQ